MLFASGMVALALGLVPARAATISFEVDAGLDTDGDSRWEDTVAGNPSGFDLELDSGVTRVAVGSSLFGITHAYDFPGGRTGNAGGALLSDTGTGTRRSFQEAPGDWSDNESVTMEIWFKPDNPAPTPDNGQILFEDGGPRGLGFFVDDNRVEYRRANVDVQTDADISSIAGDFIQVVGTYDITDGSMALYVNGSLHATGTSGGDWTGGDDAGVGTRGASNVGGIGSNQSSTESFDGKMAIFRVYRDQVLTPLEVLDSYNAIRQTSSVRTEGWADVATPLAAGGDFYGSLTAVGSGDAGANASGSFNGEGEHTNNDGDDTGAWSYGDYVLEGNFSAIPTDTVLARMDLTIPAGSTDIDLVLTFTQDMEGTLESNDAIRFEIYDVVGDQVLSFLTLADDGGAPGTFTVGDTPETLLSLDHVGLTHVQARMVYVGGWADGDQEEIQIGNAVFTATYVPEPCTFALAAVGLPGLLGLTRRRKR